MIIVETLERLARRLPSGRPPPFFKTNFFRKMAAGCQTNVYSRASILMWENFLNFTVNRPNFRFECAKKKVTQSKHNTRHDWSLVTKSRVYTGPALRPPY